jgi:hypothetical protein
MGMEMHERGHDTAMISFFVHPSILPDIARFSLPTLPVASYILCAVKGLGLGTSAVAYIFNVSPIYTQAFPHS